MKSSDEMKLTELLNGLIKKRGITITSLSRISNVPLQTLHGWLQGSEPKSIRQVKKIADFFNVDLDYLCFGIEQEKPIFQNFKEDINAGIFEVILRKKGTH